MRKAKQKLAEHRMTTIRAHKKDLNAAEMNASHDQNHKIEKMDPSMAPTTTWLIV